MQIQNIAKFNLFSSPLRIQNNQRQDNFSKYNLTMQAPLDRDTVSFKALPISKTMANRSDGISIKDAKAIRKILEKPHQKLKQVFMDFMGDILTPECQIKYLGSIKFPDVSKGLVFMKDRIKGENSLCEKTAQLKLSKRDEILENIRDISGFCFILEDKNSFKELVRRFCTMVEKGIIDPVEIEYHRRAPKIKRGRVEKSYDSLDISLIEKIKNSVIKAKNPTTQFYIERDSMSGYSGLHITVQNANGTYSEIQIQLRGVHELKEKAENATYKVRNRKALADEYDMLKRVLEPIRKKDPKELSPKQLAEQNNLQSKMTEYTQETYTDAIENHPFDKEFDFLRPIYAILEPFDFNIIRQVKALCEKIKADKEAMSANDKSAGKKAGRKK